MSAPVEATERHGAFSLLALRLGGHTLIYGISAVAGFVISVVNVAVLTRLLPPATYGRLALLLFVSGLLTVIYNVGTLQGTFLRVFGSTGEEDASSIDDEDARLAADKRRALGSALVLTIGVAGSGTLLIAVLAGELAALPLGLSDDATALRVAALCGATGAVWRLLLNVPRYERRPRLFLGLNILRPVVVVGITISLVSSHATVVRALAGTAIGNAVVCVAALGITWRSYKPGFHLEDIAAIFRRGAFFIPVIVAFWVIHNVDLYLVSLFSSDAAVARYRVASRIASGVSYFVSAFLMAWMPLSRTSLYEAVARERGLTEATARILTYFLMACFWLLLAMLVFADGLIAIAPAYYSSAAPLIPVVAAGFIAYGAFIVFYRGAQLPSRRRLYLRLSVLAALLFVPLGAVLASVAGAFGPPVAQVIVFGLAAAWIAIASQRGGNALPIHGKAVLRVSALAAVFAIVSVVLTPELGRARGLLDVTLFLVFPFGVMAIGAVPKDDVRRIKGLLGRARRRREREELLERLQRLPVDDRELLDLLVSRRLDPVRAAAMLGITELEALRRAAAALQLLADRHGTAPENDVALARYLLSRETTAERDARARVLWRGGVEPSDLEALDGTVRRLRRAPHDRGRRAAGVPGAG